MAVNHIPDGYHTVTPYLVVNNVGRLLDFLKRAFDATEIERMLRPDGSIAHAEAKIGDSIIMMGEPTGDREPMPAMLYLYLPDTDASYRRALEAGATSVTEPSDQFYGDRNAGVRDSMGNEWWIGTRKENLSMEEMNRRMAAQKK